MVKRREKTKINLIKLFISHFFIITGTLFLISTALGMLRFPDFYTRLHAGSKCLVAGGFSIIIGCMIIEGFTFNSLKLLIIIIFLLISNPVAIHAIARAAYKSGLRPPNMVRDALNEKDSL